MVHAFAYRGALLVLDVESGAVHSVDKPAFDVIRTLELGGDVRSLPYPSGLIDEILAETAELSSAGQFDSPSPAAPKRTAALSPIKSMCLNVAHDCNLRCAYCFADSGEFHGGRMLMPLETAKAALDFLIEHSMGRRNLEVDLFGGEPLMNFGVVRELVKYGRSLEKEHGKHINFTITTNGVALNDEIIDFINSEIYNLVISIDGRKQVHDALRVTPGGGGSYDIIVPKAQELIKRRGDGEYYVRGTFTAKNLDFTEDVRALADLGFERISIEPVVLPPSDPCALTEEDTECAAEEYDRLSDFMLERSREGRPFTFFHFMVDIDAAPCLAKRSLGCGAGVEYVAVAPNGNIYPCHQFVGNDDFLLGSVHGGGLNDNIREKFVGCNIFTKKKCSGCWAKYFCGGGCAANAQNLNGSIFEPPETGCRLLKKRTEIAIGMALFGRGDNEDRA